MKERDLGEGGVEQEPQARPHQKLQHWSRVWRQPAKQEAQQQRREVDPHLVSFEGVFRHHGQTMIRLHEVGKGAQGIDRKSTRLNSSHVKISYAVFCLKKKK